MEMEAAFRRYIDALNKRDFEAVPSKVRPQHILPAGFEEHEKEGSVHVSVAHVLTDASSGDLAAILHVRCSVGGHRVEFRRHVFCRFAPGPQLDSVQAVDDVDALRSREPRAVRPPPAAGWAGAPRAPHPAAGATLAETYRAYFRCVDAREMAEGIPRYCHDVVLFNGRPVPRDQYRAVMEECHEVMEEPSNTLERLVVDEERQCLAARVVFRWKPIRPWGGVTPDGTRATFAEHVFVWFDAGKMHTSISQMDMESFRRQFKSPAC